LIILDVLVKQNRRWTSADAGVQRLFCFLFYFVIFERRDFLREAVFFFITPLFAALSI